MFKGAILKIGDKVKHRTRPEFGIGQVLEITDDASCTVEFERARFSGVSIDAFATIEQLETESREAERRKEREGQQLRALEERKRKYEIDEQARANSEIVEQFNRRGVRSLWYIAHSDNITKILRHGILNHHDASRLEPNRVDISDPEAQRWREETDPHFGRRIHTYSPLYLKPRNPMLYVRRHLRDHLCLIEVDLSVIFNSEYLITDGNAASRLTKFYKSVEDIDKLPWDVLNSAYWPDYDDGKRKMCAEVLVYPKIDSKYISTLHCYSSNTKMRLGDCGRMVEVSPKLFF